MTERRDWLINFRNMQGFTQKQVAIEAEINRSTYALIELGKRSPSVATAKKISAALKFDWSIFFETNVA